MIVLDEVGYVPLADVGAEFLFQVISERAERAAIIVTTNLPFSEWTTVFPNPRLCQGAAGSNYRPGRSRSGSGERWKGGRSADVEGDGRREFCRPVVRFAKPVPPE